MRCRLFSFFLLWVFFTVPAYAVTIVNVSEALTVTELEYLSECEWIETTTTSSTITYRESFEFDPGPLIVIPPLEGSPIVNYVGFRNPCFPEPGDKEAVIPDYCFAPKFTTIANAGGGFSGDFAPGSSEGYFREWMELHTSSSVQHFNTCKGGCNNGGGTGGGTGGATGGDSGIGGGTGGETGGGNGTGGGTGGDTSGQSGGLTPVPEPGTLGLALLGIWLVLVGMRMKKEED